MNRTIKRMISVSMAFVVFGIIDNGIMVTAGSTIDHFLGSVLSISTMASAGLGNTLSDIVGIIAGRYTERFIHRLFPCEGEDISTPKIVMAEAIGITTGCLIGMTPLILL